MNAELINQIIIIFALIGAGLVCQKTKILNDTGCTIMSSFLLKVALPATILNSALTMDEVSNLTVLEVLAVACGTFIVAPLISYIVCRAFHLEPTYQLMMNYGNNGFMGMPIVTAVFGNQYGIYVAIFMMMLNIHIFSVGLMTLSGHMKSAKDFFKKLATPVLISAVIALIIVLLHIRMPSIVTSFVGSVGAITTPLALIVIGAQLGMVKIKEILGNGKLYLVVLLRLILLPAVVYGMCYLIMGPTDISKIAAILTGFPVAANVTMVCTEYDGNQKLAAEGTCLTTLFSLITVPVALALLV